MHPGKSRGGKGKKASERFLDLHPAAGLREHDCIEKTLNLGAGPGTIYFASRIQEMRKLRLRHDRFDEVTPKGAVHCLFCGAGNASGFHFDLSQDGHRSIFGNAELIAVAALGVIAVAQLQHMILAVSDIEEINDGRSRGPGCAAGTTIDMSTLHVGACNPLFMAAFVPIHTVIRVIRKIRAEPLPTSLDRFVFFAREVANLAARFHFASSSPPDELELSAQGVATACLIETVTGVGDVVAEEIKTGQLRCFASPSILTRRAGDTRGAQGEELLCNMRSAFLTFEDYVIAIAHSAIDAKALIHRDLDPLVMDFAGYLLPRLGWSGTRTTRNIERGVVPGRDDKGRLRGGGRNVVSHGGL
ncbi:hypothetical protein DW2_08692 [Thioclava atlantica]|uniref:Uncharacterized protein n=1 Tax=Thioclava atlantica TaxID=1317124 RepID=A0A085TXP7_9RHOB|nr:hypothetical protein DW2_08692 [Thioclava atlantica]